jgi:dipeptidyl aminopeptidase/acylaminoacyl peptidase
MKKEIFVFILLLFAMPGLSLIGQEVWTAEKMLLCKDTYSTVLSPDGQWVAYTVTASIMGEEESSRITHIWISAVDGSRVYQLTRGEESCSSPTWSPDGKWIAFITSRSGSANIWLIRPRYGEAIQLTDEERGVGYYKWSPDSKYIAFLMADPPSEAEKEAARTKVDPIIVETGWHYSHIYKIRADLDKGKNPGAIKITSGSFDVFQLDWSPDGKRIVFAHQPTPQGFQWRNSDISIVPAKGGKIMPLVRFPGMDQSPLYSPDGSTVAFVSVRGNQSWGRDFRICLIPAKGGEVTVLPRTHDSLPGDIWGIILAWSQDGSKIFYDEVMGTDTQLFALPVNGDPFIQVTHKPGWKGSFAIHGDGSFVTYVSSDFAEPDEVYVEYVNKKKNTWRKISNANGDLPGLPFAPSEVIGWKSFDGLEIEGILTYPLNYEKGKRYPLIVELHGGPTGAWYRVFTANTWNKNQIFAAKGFAVLQVNVRGSNGRGKAFRFANLGDWGDGDVKDVLAGVDYLVKKGLADPERLGVHGWSYGGYLTGMAISRTQRFKAAVIGAGNMDLVSGTANTTSLGIIVNFLGCEWWECEELWHDRSPSSHVADITTPTLFIYGKHDIDLPPSTGLILYRALKRKGVETRMVIYPRSGHWVYEPKLHIDFLKRLLGWFTDHL